jgi:hypothetical protein
MITPRSVCLRLVVLGVILLGFLGCNKNRDREMNPTSSDQNRSKIRTALASLLKADAGEGFAIFEEVRSQKFVQFYGSITEGLTLDLPAQAFSASELRILRNRAQELGLQYAETEAYDAPGGNVVGKQRSFSRTFDKDVDGAASLALIIFHEIYSFPTDFEFVVKFIGVTRS